MFCSESILKSDSTDFKKLGQRLFIFIVGGATRSEVELLIFSAWFLVICRFSLMVLCG